MINDPATISNDFATQPRRNLFGESTSKASERSQLLVTTQASRSYASIPLPPSCSGVSRPNLRVKDSFDVVDNVQQHGRFHTSPVEKPVYEADNSLNGCFSILPAWTRRVIPIAVIGTMVFSYATVFLWLFVAQLRSTDAVSNTRHTQRYDQVVLPIVERSWAAYTPYYSVEPYEAPPTDCQITQVNIIQRHGARYPTSGSSPKIRSAITKLQSVDHYTDRRLDFLKNYTYSLGVADLVAFGAFEAQLAGQTSYERYANLISHDKLPFIRSSGGQRVVESAQNWTFGLSVASGRVYEPTVSVIFEENAETNNTLDDNNCPSAGTPDNYTLIWTNIFAPSIATRLNQQAPGANIAAADVPNLMSVCAFETVAKFALSPFCGLFSPEEFAEYEYLGDIEKYYNKGYGQRLGPVQGVGYVNELLARLTNKPVQDNTQTNRTLDTSPITFPLNQTLYADFSHDNEMIAIYSAMGLFKQSKDLDPKKPDPARTWVASRLTPFSGRMVTERLECDGHSKKIEYHSEAGVTHKKRRGTYVRILVNDALQPLGFCDADDDQLCELDKFVESQGYARRNGYGDFEKCFQ